MHINLGVISDKQIIASQSKLRGDSFNYQRYARTHRYRKRYPAVGSVGSIRSIGNLMKLGRIAYR